MNTNDIKKWIENERKSYNDKIFDLTLKYQQKYKFEIGKGEHSTWNNEADAFKHAFGSAKAAFDYGMLVSIKEFDRHEKVLKNNPTNEENMDRWNNYKGRDIAREIKKEYPNWKKLKEEELNDIIASKVLERMKNDDLITKPSSNKKIDKSLINKLDILNITEKDYKKIEHIIKDNNIDTWFNKNKDINEVNEEIKRKHEQNKQHTSFVRQEQNETDPRYNDALLKTIIYAYQTFDRGQTNQYRINQTLPKILKAVARVNGLPLKNVADFFLTEMRKQVNKQILEGKIFIPDIVSPPKNSIFSGNSDGHWVTINHNHVFIKDS